MRVLIAHNRYRSSSPSGEDRVVDQEHAVLADAGHDVERFERHSDDIARRSFVGRAVVPAQVVWARTSALELGTVLETFRPDIVHFHNLFPLLSPSVLRSAERHRVPTVVTFHNYQQVCVNGMLYRAGSECRACVGRAVPWPGLRHGCYHGSVVATLPLALSLSVHRRLWRTIPAAYVFLSEVQRRELLSLDLDPARCFVKANLVPPVQQRRDVSDLVVYLGRLTEAKGVRVLMRAWDLYVETGGPGGHLRLAIAGSGPLEAEVRSWAERHSSVQLLGLVSRAASASLVARSAAVIVPSEWREPFGLVGAEAMAAGVAPVTTSNGAFGELISDGVDGLLYPPGDHRALAEILRRIARSPRYVEDLGRAARNTYLRRFTPRQVLSELEAIYQFAMDHPRSVSPIPRKTHPAAPLEPGPEEAGLQEAGR